MEFLAGWDLVSLIKTAGYAGLFVIVFAESGLFIGFFLPGDSLLFTAGFLASQGFLNVWPLALLMFLAAILGDNFGYSFGKKVGPAIFSCEDSWLFHRDHLERARIFYERHGAKTLVLARFLPIVRTFAPILAGVGRMHYPTFFFYNILGAALWALGITWLGYFLGATIPGVDKYLIPIILVIIVVSILPTLIHILRNRNYAQK
ncbi:MAG: VTT domain-containing protein [Candidatus Giovannonibacteria bacterium]|nr:MAG: VTT domain-containing protein [Candidatus Giovannonibacteria bacterium]